MIEIGRVMRLERHPQLGRRLNSGRRFERLLKPVAVAACSKVIAVAFALAMVASSSVGDSLHPYLSARIALADRDHALAERFIETALMEEPEAVPLLRFAFQVAVESGDRQQAIELAGRLKALDVSSQLLTLVQLVGDLERKRFRRIAQQAEDGSIPVPAIADLAGAWAKHGRGNFDQAQLAFEKAAVTGFRYRTALTQLSLILALEGDFEGANTAMNIAHSDSDEVPADVRLAWAQIRATIHDYDGALALLEDVGGNDDIRRRSDSLRLRIAAGEPVAFDLVSSPQEGLGRLFALAATDPERVLVAEKRLIYARLATALDPTNAVALPLIEALTEAVQDRFLGSTMSQPADALVEFIAERIDADASSPRVRLITLQTHLAEGDLFAAQTIATELFEAGYEDETILLSMLVGDIVKGQHDSIAKVRPALQASEPWSGNLINAWAAMTEGDVAGASAAISLALKSDEDARMVHFQQALALAASGRFESAINILALQGTPTRFLNPEELALLAQLHMQLDSGEAALERLEKLPDETNNHRIAVLLDLRDDIEAGRLVPITLDSPRLGMGEVLATIARRIVADDEGASIERFQLALIYARLAEFLNPDSESYKVQLGELLYDLNYYPLSAESYGQVRLGGRMGRIAAIGKARALREAGDVEASLAALNGDISMQGPSVIVYHQMGDILRFEERYEEARTSYLSALALVEENGEANWRLYYGLGIANERLDDWEQAEPHFRQALELSDGNAYVLNYLGYTMVEKRQDLDEAEELIRKAVEAEPDNGYFVDSLGWVLYRKGKFEEAVLHLKYAAQLVPSDPVIIDHLGDAYWRVGEDQNARLQWQRALSFDPEDELIETINLKLKEGLPAAVEEAPASATNEI